MIEGDSELRIEAVWLFNNLAALSTDLVRQLAPCVSTLVVFLSSPDVQLVDLVVRFGAWGLSGCMSHNAS
jgi:hypothetical protein